MGNEHGKHRSDPLMDSSNTQLNSSNSSLTANSSSGDRPRRPSKDLGNTSPFLPYSPNMTSPNSSSGHRRRRSDVGVEQRAARIKDIVNASKTTDKQRTIRKKKLDQQQEELEKTEESLLMEEQEMKRKSQYYSNEASMSASGLRNSAVLDSSRSSVGSSSSLYFSANSTNGSTYVSNSTNIRKSNSGQIDRLKNKVYSYAENETDYSFDSSSPATSTQSSQAGTPAQSRAPSPPLTPDEPHTPRKISTSGLSSPMTPQSHQSSTKNSPNIRMAHRDSIDRVDTIPQEVPDSENIETAPSITPVPTDTQDPVNTEVRVDPIVLSINGSNQRFISLGGYSDPDAPHEGSSPNTETTLLNTLANSNRSANPDEKNSDLQTSPSTGSVRLHRKTRSHGNSVSFLDAPPIDTGDGYTDSSETNPLQNSGYATTESEFRGTSPRNMEKSSSSRSVSEVQSSNFADDDGEGTAEEVIQNLKQLNDEEKITVASTLAFRHPAVMKELRDHLRISMKAKVNQRILQYTQSPNEINWNARFQTLIEDLRTCEDVRGRMELYSEMAKLAQDFIYCAKTYGKLIISEVYAPFEEKTIKPISVGGQLGGLKYVVKNILFKFAVDQYDLFQSDEHAAKVAGHDLKGLISYFNLGIPGLHFPLMALVDYVGFRLQALSLLPINAETLIYGTGDGGRTIKAENPKFQAKMRLAADKLNLKPHTVGLSKTNGKLLYSCADIEGHHGFDGRYYAIDFSRSFPPMDPDKSTKNAHLFRLFRPEFIKQYPTPLCPDAFSGFVANFQADEHIQQIREATDYLYTKVIADFAEELNLMSPEETESLSIKHALHKKGINLSLMGVLRQQVKEDSKFHQRLLIEMIARTTYHIINEKLREKMKELRIPSQQPYKVVITEQLNLLFGNSDKTYEYWNGPLKKAVSKGYPFALTPKESGDTYNIKKQIFDNSPLMCELFRRVSKTARFNLTTKLHKDFCTNFNLFMRMKTPFDDNDLEELVEGIKHTNIVSLSMGFYTMNKASSKTGEELLRMLNLTKERFQEALDSNPEDKQALRELAHIEALLGNIDQAERNYLEAIQADPMDSVTLFRYAEFLDKLNERGAEEYYLKALENDPTDECCLRSYADFLRKVGNLDEADKFYELARRQSKVSSVKEEEIFENRRRPVLGTDFGSQFLLPTDHRGGWSTKEGTPKTMGDVKLPSNWEWIEEWSVDTTRPGVDENGWEYSLSWNSTWVATPGTLTYVSRRRWKRVRRSVLLYLGEDEEVESIPVDEVISQMKDPVDGVQIKDRTWYMKTYQQCFVGNDCVHWLMDKYSLTRKQAIKLGNKLLTKRLIAHVENQHLFSDAQLYYHFITPNERSAKTAKKFDEIKKEGYLEKQGAFVKSWKKRYFVLKKGTLYYYSKAQQVIPRGIISLVQATVVPVNGMKASIHMPPNYATSSFVIRTGRRNFFIKAKDPTEREEWMQAIEKNCI